MRYSIGRCIVIEKVGRTFLLYIKCRSTRVGTLTVMRDYKGIISEKTRDYNVILFKKCKRCFCEFSSLSSLYNNIFLYNKNILYIYVYI